ncbi:MAG: hypothetical protein UT24_C0022G0010 [Candidatus Woesebacteria bacterium GW2011_GWB1_39_12]|uniref:Uncharacterized protein n=1 Tax=Candidatus Woesebacteria bacterium GW2011_GWB1_39_12 TaxID=1618574 RepID=A0A0G0PP12_9BACT|nr:MAG: hypothetical protein UT24_C0022G0010 [Candidatus Woesebacteria bacterium GW2011_GWB1_39_12]
MSEKMYRVKNKEGKFYSSGTGYREAWTKDGKFFQEKMLKKMLNNLLYESQWRLIYYPNKYDHADVDLPKIFDEFAVVGGKFEGCELIEYSLDEVHTEPLVKSLVQRLKDSLQQQKLHHDVKKMLYELEKVV